MKKERIQPKLVHKFHIAKNGNDMYLTVVEYWFLSILFQNNDLRFKCTKIYYLDAYV